MSGPWIITPLHTGPIPVNSYTCTISSLSASTIYEYHAYMVVDGLPYTGTTYQISTLPPTYTIPTITTSGITLIGQTTATGGGNVTSSGGTNVTTRGVTWNVTQNPIITGSHTIDGSGTGIFVSSLTGLLSNTTYYVRAYAINGVGIGYGNQVSFITLDIKNINLSVCQYNNGDGSQCSCKWSHIVSTPDMILGECYCISLNSNLFLALSQVNSGSYACVCVICNGAPALIDTCLTSLTCIPHADTSFTFCYGDVVDIYDMAYTVDINCSGIACSQTVIGNISSISGLFQKGTSCIYVDAYTG